MLNPIVKKYLYSLNAREVKQKKNNQFIIDYPTSAFLSNDKELLFIKKFFLKNNYVFISKHNRFADYPEHGHEFIELNYMLDGMCNQIVNGQELTLYKGNVLLLNSKSRHEIKALAENDILINIIFPKEKFDIEWMTKMYRQNSPLFSFLMQDISERSKKEFIVFESSENLDVQITIEKMINNYFTDSVFSNEILRFFVPILFMELIGKAHYTLTGASSVSETNGIIINSLNLITANFETLTLSGLSKELHYSKNYLSNLIKGHL